MTKAEANAFRTLELWVLGKTRGGLHPFDEEVLDALRFLSDRAQMELRDPPVPLPEDRLTALRTAFASQLHLRIREIPCPSV